MKVARSIVFYHVAHAEEADAVFQERGYHYFIGSINDAKACSLRDTSRFVGECQIAETFRVGVAQTSGSCIWKNRACPKEELIRSG